MKFRFRRFAFFICYCICALIVFISFICSSTYEKEKDIYLMPIREAEKPVEYEDPISTVIDISEHIVDIDALENPKEFEDPVSTVIDISEHIVDIDALENPTEFKGSMVLPIIKKERQEEKEQELEIDIPNIEKKYKDEIPYIARTVWGEARGCSETEQAAVIWCILNRVDSSIRYMPDNIIDVVTQKHQFLGYVETFPVTEEIRKLVIDVLTRWEMEKAGVENVGRVLPPEYMWFHGDGRHNHFRDSYRGGNRWDWSLDSPYED